MKVRQRSRWLARAAASAVLALGLACGTVTVAGDAQARPVPTRSVGASWGIAIYGNLGFGRPGENGRTLAGPVTGLAGVRQVAAGGLHSLVLASDGSVWAWGHDDDGQLGDDDAGRLGYSTTPVQVRGLTGITQIAAGFKFGLALRSDGTVWAWGDNNAGEIGNGTHSGTPSLPTEVTGLTGVTQVSAGLDFSLATHNVRFIAASA